MSLNPAAKHERKNQELLHQFGVAPLVEVLGVVGASGVGAAQFQGQTSWTLRLQLDGWRLGTGPLQESELSIQGEVSRGDFEHVRRLCPAYQVVRLRAKVVEHSPFGDARGLLDTVLQSGVPDTELEARAAILRMPRVHADRVLGRLSLDRAVGRWEGAATWAGRRVRVHLDAPSHERLPELLKTAHALWQDQASWERRMRDFALAELVTLKNESWLLDDEPPITPAQFDSRLKLDSIGITPAGEFDFWFEGKELFSDHAIRVMGDLVRGPKDATLEG